MLLNFGLSGRSTVSRAVGISLAVMLGLSLAYLPVAKAEQSDATIEAIKKRKLKKGGIYASSVQISHPVATGRATTDTEVFTGQTVQPMLSADGAAALQAAEDKYAAIVSSGGWPKVPRGTYKKGSDGNDVAALNQRLFIEGYVRREATEGEFAGIYTSATQDAVMRFQRNHGLAVSGQVDGLTLQALNVSAADRLSTIRANIPRIAEYSKDLGDRYIVVNVPAQQIETVNGGHVYSRHNAIVGRPERPTPVVMTALSNVAFNPYWNAPPSIIERDIIPKMLSGNTDILRNMNIKVFQGFGGPEIDPRRVNWRRAVADDYHFRQEPGGDNAMATAKINFDSPFGIYLHDTPEKQLFDSYGRFYSSGCVRVQKVEVLLNWVLNGQDGYDANRIAYMAESLERLDVPIVNPPQLRVAYLTAWPTADGIAAFRNDVYRLDGTGFVVGQPLPVGEKSETGQRFVLKPIQRQPSAIDEAEADGFFWFGRRSARNSDDADTKPKVKKTRSTGLFAWDKEDPKDAKKKVVKKKLASTDKKKTVVVDAKKTTEKAATKVASTSTKKVVKPTTPAAKKTEDLCKPDKDGNVPKDCKVEAVVKPAVKPVANAEETASATN